MMKNIAKIMICFSLSLWMISIGIAEKHRLPEIKSFAAVTGEYITLGDIMTGLEVGRDVEVAKAPALGKKITISAHYILKITKEHNILWQNSKRIKRVTVKRPAKVFRYKQLSSLIRTKLGKAVGIYQPNERIFVPQNTNLKDLKLSMVKVDQNTGRFTAKISAPAGGNKKTTHALSGYLIKTTMVPTLNRDIYAGQKIKRRDIKWYAIATSRISNRLARTKDDLIGMAAKRQIKSGHPIKMNDLRRPALIKKGTMISMVFNIKGMSLSARGKAIDSGASGDVIRVMNSTSHKTIEGVIISSDEVRIITPKSNRFASLTQ